MAPWGMGRREELPVSAPRAGEAAGRASGAAAATSQVLQGHTTSNAWYNLMNTPQRRFANKDRQYEAASTLVLQTGQPHRCAAVGLSVAVGAANPSLPNWMLTSARSASIWARKLSKAVCVLLYSAAPALRPALQSAVSARGGLKERRLLIAIVPVSSAKLLLRPLACMCVVRASPAVCGVACSEKETLLRMSRPGASEGPAAQQERVCSCIAGQPA
jgi:hypothetical protein